MRRTCCSQIEQGHGDLGRQIAALCAKRPPFSHESTPPPNQLEGVLGQASDHIQHLKQTLLSVDSQIRELKLETIHHELLTLQQDLSLRAAAIERFPVVKGSPIVGRTLAAVGAACVSSSRHGLAWTIFRAARDALVLRVDDVLIMIGLQAELAQLAFEITQPRNAKSV